DRGRISGKRVHSLWTRMVQLQQKKDARAKEEHSTPNTIHHRLGQTGKAEQSLCTVSGCPLNIPRDEPRGRRIGCYGSSGQEPHRRSSSTTRHTRSCCRRLCPSPHPGNSPRRRTGTSRRRRCRICLVSLTLPHLLQLFS